MKRVLVIRVEPFLDAARIIVILDRKERIIVAGASADVRRIEKDSAIDDRRGIGSCQVDIEFPIAGFVSDGRKANRVVVQFLVPDAVAVLVYSNRHFASPGA